MFVYLLDEDFPQWEKEGFPSEIKTNHITHSHFVGTLIKKVSAIIDSRTKEESAGIRYLLLEQDIFLNHYRGWGR